MATPSRTPFDLRPRLAAADRTGYSQQERHMMAANSDGRLEVLLTGADRQIWHGFQRTAGDPGSWTCCGPLGGYWPGEPVVATAPPAAGGRMELFAIGADGQLWHGWQQTGANSGSWTCCAPLGGTWPSNPVAGVDADGRMEVFLVGRDGQLWRGFETVAGDPTSWRCCTPMGGVWPGQPAVAREADGRLEVFLRGADGQIWHGWENAPSQPGSWSCCGPIGGSFPDADPQAVNAGGRIELFVTGGDRALWHAWQSTPNSTAGWQCCASLGGVWPGDPTLAVNALGGLEVYLRGMDAQLWRAVQGRTGDPGSFACCAPLGGNWPADATAATNLAGRTELMMIGSDHQLWHASEASGPGTFGCCGPLGGYWPFQPGSPPLTRILPVPFYHQSYELSCEEASLRMILAYEGIGVTEDQILAAEGIDWRAPYYDGYGRFRWGDPYDNFVGDPNGSEVQNTGYGTYETTIGRVAPAFGGRVMRSGERIAPGDLYSALIAGHPAVVWVSFDWAYHATTSYLAFDGDPVMFGSPYEHAVAVVGVSPDSVLINNPWSGPEWISRPAFEAAYATFDNMAVILQ